MAVELGGATMEVLNPASGDVIATVPRGAASDVEQAVAAATHTLPAWRDTPAGERAELLFAFADALNDHRDELAELESRNAGKPLPAAREEIAYSIDNLRFFAGAARAMPGVPAAGEYVATHTSIVGSLVVGDPAEGDHVEMGPLISEAQRERVLGFVDRATSTGAQVLTGGNAGRGPGYFVEPTVITGVRQDDEIVQREVFGPVVTVQRASSDAEAVTLANDVAYGLASSVWTNDVRKALTIARDLEYGTVWINDHLPMASEMPAGGYKESGYGKDMGVQAMEAYTQVKHVMAKL